MDTNVEELERNRLFYENIIQTTPDIVFVFDLEEARTIFTNHRVESILGYTSEQILAIQDVYPTLLHPDDLIRLPVVLEQLTAGRDENIFTDDFRVLAADGTYRWLSIRAAVFKRSNNGLVKQIIGTTTDITGRKRMERDTALTAKFPEEDPNPVMRLSPDGYVLYANEAGKLLLEFWRVQTGEPISEKLRTAVRQVHESQAKKEIEIEYNEKTFSCTLVSIPEAGYVNLYGNEITQRKRTQVELRMARENADEIAARISRLQKVTAALSEALTPLHVADVMVYQAAPALGAVSGTMMVLNEEAQTLEIVRTAASEAVANSFRSTSLTLQIPATDAVRFGQTVWIESQQQYLQKYPHIAESIVKWGLQAAVAVPMIDKGRTLGVLNLSFAEARPYTPEDDEYILTLATQGAQALERARLFQEVQHGLAELQATYDQSPIGMLQFDAELRYRRVNRTLAAMNGIPPAEHIGKTIREIVPDLADKLETQFRNVMETGEPIYNIEVPGETQAEPGVPHVWLESFYPLRDEEGKIAGLNVVVQDITRRKKDERALATFARQQEALFQLADQLHRTSSLVAMFEAALNAIISALESDRASILLFNDEGVMRFVAWRGLSDGYRAATDGHSPWTPAETHPEPIAYDDIRTADLSDALKEIIEEEGIGSLAFIPLVFEGKLIGKFMVYFNRPYNFNENDLEISLTIGRQLAFAVQRNRAEEALQASETLYRKIAQNIPNGGVYVIGKDMRYLVAEGPVTEAFDLSREMLEGHTVWEVFSPEQSERMEARFAKNLAGETVDYETVYKDRVYWTRQAPLHDSLGQIIIVTVDVTERKQAENALQIRARQQQAVARLGELALREHDLQIVFNRATEILTRTLEVEYSKVLQLLPSGETLLLRAGVGWKAILVGNALIGAGIESQAGFTLASNAPVIVTDLREETRFSGPPLLLEHNVISGMSCIIHQIDGTPWGVLGTHSTRQVSFTEDDVSFLLAIANILENAIHREQAEQALRESQEQLHALNDTLEQQVRQKTREVRILASNLTKAEHRERHRIAQILHDDLQQRLYAIQIQLGLLHSGLDPENMRQKQDFAELNTQLEEVVEMARNLSVDLSPPILHDEGLAQAIYWLSIQMRDQYGLQVTLQAEESFVIPDRDLEVLLYNCTRELLFNIVKHAGVNQAWVTLQHQNGDLRIEVRDEGDGFKIAEQLIWDRQKSFGLPTLRHRFSVLGGQMDIHSEPGKGTQVILTIPLNPHV